MKRLLRIYVTPLKTMYFIQKSSAVPLLLILVEILIQHLFFSKQRVENELLTLKLYVLIVLIIRIEGSTFSVINLSQWMAFS